MYFRFSRERPRINIPGKDLGQFALICRSSRYGSMEIIEYFLVAVIDPNKQALEAWAGKNNMKILGRKVTFLESS
ncbi:unnamed protein product [Trifolium pratense]|uniref:Uncharacterized protein n=1 Tax=Trifolium pratense TaxID=57577 RepID=A0ACB0L2F6_TRIPR|nr:unnamed protein product [Trifolium pratense]